jgi:hypothetical protein
MLAPPRGIAKLLLLEGNFEGADTLPEGTATLALPDEIAKLVLLEGNLEGTDTLALHADAGAAMLPQSRF